MTVSTAKQPAIAEDRAFVVYDAGTGEIRHLHRVTVFAGAATPPWEGREGDERLALAAARQMNHPTENLKVLAIDPKELAECHARQVDLQSGRLVEREPPPRSRV